MGIRTVRPMTNGQRQVTYSDFKEITTEKPFKPLTVSLRRGGGRNNKGRLTVRHIGGGNKRKYRQIDFKRDKIDVIGKVEHIEYDPNRSCRIARILYPDGERRYIICPNDLNQGDSVTSGNKVEPRTGNTMPLKNIPTGLYIHNIELVPGKGGQLVRSAGTFAQLLAKEGNYADVLLPSGEIRKIHAKCMATIGQVGNIEHSLISIGKAGRKRWLGTRPTVRGIAQNPVSHPMGGGVGRKVGRDPVSKFGKQLAKGGITRNPRKVSDRFIIKRRRFGKYQVRVR